MRKNYNILYISNLYSPYVVGGAETLAKHLAEKMAKKGNQVTIVTTENPDNITSSQFNYEKINDVDLVRYFPINEYWLYNPGEVSIREKLIWHLKDNWNIDSAKKIGVVLDEVKPDIVHTHNINGFSPVVWNEAKKRNIPTVHTAHDYNLICPKGTLLRGNGDICQNPHLPCKIYNRWNSFNSKNIDVFTAPSRFVLDIHQNNGFKAKKYKVVENGIPGNVSTNNIVKKDSKSINLLFLGQIAKHKGILPLIEAFMKIPKEKPVYLNIAGKGPLVDHVLKASEKDNRIIYHGFVNGESKEQLLNDIDALIIPSLWHENAPISIIESYNNGIPVISSNLGGLPEMVEHNVTGLIFDPNKKDDLLSVLNKFISNNELRNSLQKNAFIRANRYTVDNMASEYIKIYNSLIN